MRTREFVDLVSPLRGAGHGARRSLACLLLCFSVPLPVPPAAAAPADSLRVRSIAVEGNRARTEADVLAAFAARPGGRLDTLRLAAEAEALASEYRRDGWLGARVSAGVAGWSDDGLGADLLVRVDEGKRAVVRAVVFEGATVFTADELERMTDLSPGDALDEAILERDIGAILKAYENAGFPLARCSVARVEAVPGGEEDALAVTVRVEEGKRVTLQEVRVEGNVETDAGVIVREARVTPGEVYDPRKVERVRGRLQRLNIFAEVAEPELYMRDDRGGLLLRVKEGNSNTFDGILGYIPGAAPGEAGYLTGMVAFSMRNLFGTGRKLGFRWQRDDRYSQDLALRYLEPWLFGWPVNAGVGFQQRQQDTSYVRRVIDGKLEVMFSEEVTAGVVVAGEAVIPSATVSGAFFLRSSTVSVGAELLYDSRDDPYNPTAGGRFRTDYLYGRRKTDDVPQDYPVAVDRNVSVGRLTVDADLFLEVFARQVAALGIHGRELTGDQSDEAQMFRFGGARTLRGYRENQFVGTRVAWTNLEYRFILARRSYLFGFFDAGYYLRPADAVRGLAGVEEFKPGYGVGLLVDTPIGVMGVSFALGQGDSFGQAKIHVGIVNEF